MHPNSKTGKQAKEIIKKTSFPTRPTLLTRSTPNIILFVSYSIYKHDSLSPNTVQQVLNLQVECPLAYRNAKLCLVISLQVPNFKSRVFKVHCKVA